LRCPIADDGSEGHHANMIAALMLIAATPTSGCDLGNLNSSRAVYEALGRRAIDIIAAGSTGGQRADDLLDRLVDPSASFDLVIGDVGSPGIGAAGARALAKTVNADEFRFLGWDYMDGPAVACREQKVTLDFISSRRHRLSRIEFTFYQARLMAAKAWQRSFQSGPLISAASN
jgi:hypothetical protein